MDGGAGMKCPEHGEVEPRIIWKNCGAKGTVGFDAITSIHRKVYVCPICGQEVSDA